jgi:hypothetical protein
MREAAGIPGVLGLIGILYQLLRDEAQHQRNLLRQHDQQLFDLGATSHMANVAFDKHVVFCEEYVFEMHATIQTLFREGPSKGALEHASKLYEIQQKHATWLTPEIEKQLDPFEKALRRIGASAYLYSSDPGLANASGRVEEMFDVFSDVLSLAKDPETPVNREVAIATIISRLRYVLGIEQLTALRQGLLTSRGHANPELVTRQIS